MKKIAILLTMALLLCCTGCSKGTVTQEEYDALKEKYEALQSEYESMKSEAVETTEPETVPEESTEPEAEAPTEEEQTASKAPDEEVDVSEVTTIRGGTNQNDAVLLPMNTKLYGSTSDGQGLWYAFTTGDDANTTYQISMINKTVGSNYASVYVYDELGAELAKNKAANSGIASTVNIENLLPDTTYYLRVLATDKYYNVKKDTIDYMMLIRNPNEQSNAYNTTGSLAESIGTPNTLDEVNPGTNQDDAAYIPTDAKLSGTVKEGIGLWFAFTTGSSEGTYQFILVNETVGSNYVAVYVYDELGNEIAKHNASSDGVASTCEIENLLPNTTYYLRALATDKYFNVKKDTIDYTLTIRSPEEPAANTATVETVEKEQLVFETPFELNSTQVMFVANKAVFLDENAAKAALAPVAEVILAHPDHPILLAGTTATAGTQESCVDLSNRRAEAVKNLLVSAFGVPESQIQTIGLGYEADPFVRGKDRDANGNFVETEGAKNRRVVVLDVEDPIAKELLGQ